MRLWYLSHVHKDLLTRTANPDKAATQSDMSLCCIDLSDRSQQVTLSPVPGRNYSKEYPRDPF